MQANVYRRLVGPDPGDGTKVVGDAAKSWTVSPDGRVFTFVLRPDVIFPSGKAVTAEDAAFSLQRVVLLNKTPGFIITQFGFTKDNVEDADQGDRRPHAAVRAAHGAGHQLRALLPVGQVGSIVEKATVHGQRANGDLGNGWLKTHVPVPAAISCRPTPPASTSRWMQPACRYQAGARRIIIRHMADASAQAAAAEGGHRHRAQPDGGPAQDGARQPGLPPDVGAAERAIYIALNQADAEAGEAAGAPGAEMGDRLRGHRHQYPPNSYDGAAELPAAGPARRADRQAVHQDTAKAKALMAEAGLSRRVLRHMDCPSSPLSRYRAGDPG